MAGDSFLSVQILCIELRPISAYRLRFCDEFKENRFFSAEERLLKHGSKRENAVRGGEVCNAAVGFCDGDNTAGAKAVTLAGAFGQTVGKGNSARVGIFDLHHRFAGILVALHADRRRFKSRAGV